MIIEIHNNRHIRVYNANGAALLVSRTAGLRERPVYWALARGPGQNVSREFASSTLRRWRSSSTARPVWYDIKGRKRKNQ